MLILGQKYNFTKLELKRLDKKFISINKIIYNNKNPKDVIDEIEATLQKDRFSVIVLNSKGKVDDKIIKYLTNLKYDEKYTNIKMISIEHFLEEYLHKCYIPASNDDLHYLDDIKPFTLWQRFQKRFVDLIGAMSLFLVFIFVRNIVKKKINEQNPGDIYFRQLRVGLNNKEFACIKFRSMRLDAEKDGVQFASKEGDSRVFPFGDFMRRTRVDEIPQLFNIFKGEMSFIGPRPERKYWIEKDFEQNIPYYAQRHIVKPGITGWAQVMYPYGDGVEDTKQKLMYDLYYIKHWNIFLELQIIYKTILVVVGKKGV